MPLLMVRFSKKITEKDMNFKESLLALSRHFFCSS
jgi:hypothetical protein